MEMPKLLIVDDDEDICRQMKWALAEDYQVFLAGDRPSALEVLARERPPLVTLDLGLPPYPQSVEEGFQALGEILQRDGSVKVIVITGQEERNYALQSISQGAYDFFPKPIQIAELKVVLRRAVHVYQLEQEHRELKQRLEREPFEEMLGTSPKMQDVFAAIRRVATADAPVLITGESGTGKELAARAIHRQSARSRGAFVVINCGAIPETLLESELFGHEKGAFTGAHVQRKGRIEAAHGGTLFLDEIGELPLSLQVKLLRFLQERRIERVGGREPIDVDARVLVATNMDLKQAMAAGRFREDLYYRVAVVTIAIPRLRERGEDIRLLAEAALRRHATEMGKKIAGLTQQALREIQSYDWPGNVRELENRIKRAVIMSERRWLTPADLELAPSHLRYKGAVLKQAREALEREMVETSLARHRGNITKVAAELGVSRPTLYELMEKLGIKRGLGQQLRLPGESS